MKSQRHIVMAILLVLSTTVSAVNTAWAVINTYYSQGGLPAKSAKALPAEAVLL